MAEGSKGKGNIAVSHQEVLSGQELSFAHDNLPKRDTFEAQGTLRLNKRKAREYSLGSGL